MSVESLYYFLQNNTDASSLPKSQIELGMQILEDRNIITVNDLLNYGNWAEIDLPENFLKVLSQIPSLKIEEKIELPQQIMTTAHEVNDIFDTLWISIGDKLAEKLAIVANRCGDSCLTKELIQICGLSQQETIVEKKLKEFVLLKLRTRDDDKRILFSPYSTPSKMINNSNQIKNISNNSSTNENIEKSPESTRTPIMTPSKIGASKRYSRLEQDTEEMISKVLSIITDEIIDSEVSIQISSILNEFKQVYDVPSTPTHRRNSVVEQYLPKYGKDFKVDVVGSKIVKKDGNQWTEYQIVVKTNLKEYSHLVLPGVALDVYRRYSEFEELHKLLSNQLGPKFQFSFPKKATFTRFRDSTVEERNTAFQELLDFLSNEKQLVTASWVINFFDDAKRKS